MTVRFERDVRASPDEVYAAISDPATVRRWLATCELEPTVGGRVHLVWPNDEGEMHGVVTAVSPGSALEYSWSESEDDDETSLLRWEITPRGGEATLRLTHSGTSPKDALGFGAGWQAHLEALDVVLSGGEPTPGWTDDRYRELRPLYEEQFGAK
jgi:uncharacterized protein YndB with AHSA1/START domain